MWDLTGDWHVAGSGDFNGDNQYDVLLWNDDGRVTDWLGANYDGTLAPNPNAAYTMGSNWTLLGIGDFNGDDRDDLMWRNDQGQLSEWLGNTDGTFTWNSSLSATMLSNWEMLGTGDFNGDSRCDLLWRNENGTLVEWRGQANGTFVQNSSFNYTMGSNWELLGTGDFNGDGCDDLMWRDQNGALSEWTGNYDWQNTTAFWLNTSISATMGSNWELLGSGDFNGNGRDDLLWQNDEGALSQWVAQSDGTFWQGSTIEAGSTQSTVAGIGDYNGDSRDDILWRNADGAIDTGMSSSDGSLQTPEGKVWQHAIATVSEFFDAVTNQVSGYSSGGGDQNSYYDDGSDHSPFSPGFMEMWGWLPSVQRDPAAHYWDFLTQDIDPEFTEFVMTSLEGAGFSADFGAHEGSISLVDAPHGIYLMNVDGVSMRVEWHPNLSNSTDPPSEPGAITITGHPEAGYWTATPINGGLDHISDQPPPPPGGGSTWNGPPLNQVNPIGLLSPPDQAQYYLPEGITDTYLLDALNYLSNYARTHNHFDLLQEFKRMYQDPTHPHFIDFKDWGTSNGPAGVAPVAPITYFSPALGQYVTTSPFEAFGNWFYGFAGRWAGIQVSELLAAAAVMQEGSTGWFPADSPEDQPHVAYGMNSFTAFVADPETVFTIYTSNGS